MNKKLLWIVSLLLLSAGSSTTRSSRQRYLRLGGSEPVPSPVRPFQPLGASYSSESSVNSAMLRVRT